MRKVKGFSFYQCKSHCGKMFGIEYPDYNEELSTNPICPECLGKEISFIEDKDVEYVGEVAAIKF